MTYYVTNKNDELYHHGVPGMRWGVRHDDRPHSRTKKVVSGTANVKKGTAFGKELTAYKDKYGTYYGTTVSKESRGLAGRREGNSPSHTITKNQGRPARAPKYANPNTVARFRGSERPHTAEQVVTTTPITGGSSISEEDRENDVLNRGKKFVKSLFDKKYKLSVGTFSISVTKKGKISKAIDVAKNWLKNLFG